MSLRFVGSDLTTTRLALNYIEGMTHIPLPDNLKNWGESSRAHGKTLISDKYDNIPITLALRVEGTDYATRNAAITALVAEITQDNILEYTPDPAIDPIYYETFKYDTGDPQGLFDRALGENPQTPVVYPFMVELQAKPFAQGGWEDLVPLESLIGDWSFEVDLVFPSLSNPRGVAAYGDYVYICDSSNHRIVKCLSTNLSYVDEIGSQGSGDDQFNLPPGIATDGTHIWVVDTYNHRIVKRDAATLAYVSKIGSLGSGDDQFNQPSGIATDGTHIWVADTFNHRIVKRDAATLAYVSKIGSSGSGDDQFNLPSGVATDGTHIWVADTDNHRIAKRLASDLSYVEVPNPWIPTEVNGTGTATAEQSDTQALFGDYSCELSITSDDGEAYITSPFITVDRENPHALLLNYYHAGGGDSLSIKVEQYDDAGGALADLLDDTGIGGTTAWRSIQYELTGFHADCAQVKIEIKVDTAIAEFYIDGVAFADAKYLSEGLITNALGLAIPAADIKGDLPTPVDIYIQKWDSDVAETRGILVGQRKKYSAGFTPRIPTDESDADVYSALAGFDETATAGTHMGTRRSIPLTTPLCLNPDFELHDDNGNATIWTNWTAARSGSGQLVPSSGPYKYHGTWGVGSQGFSTSVLQTNTMTSSAMVINPANTHTINIMHWLRQVSGKAQFKVDIYCFSDAAATTPTTPASFNVLDTKNHQDAWKPLAAVIAPGDWPPSTIRAKIVITGSAMAKTISPGSVSYDVIAFDWLSFRQVDYVFIFDGSEHIERIRGYVLPVLHYCLNAAQADKVVEFYGNLVHDTYGEIGGVKALQRATLNMPATWVFEDVFQVMHLSTSGMGPDADLSEISQRLVAHIDSEMAAGTIYMDEIVLIPQDKGAAFIPSESNRFLVLDSHSSMPLVLKSFDGTKAKAMVESNAILKRRFTLDPNGTNYALLMRHAVDDGEIAQFTANIRLRYRPRYLVVA